MAGKKILRWLALFAAVFWLVAGCAGGVLYQKEAEDGGVHRLRIDSAEGWSDYDTTPRYRSQKNQDGYGIVMKNEATF